MHCIRIGKSLIVPVNDVTGLIKLKLKYNQKRVFAFNSKN